jgi:hypothetical protein
MSSMNRAAAPSLRTPRRLRRRPLKASAPGAGRRSGPATPLLKWDLGGGGGSGEGRKKGGAEDAAAAREVSVRKLAAGVWRLRPPEAVPGGAGGGERRVRVGVEVRSRGLVQHVLRAFAGAGS